MKKGLLLIFFLALLTQPVLAKKHFRKFFKKSNVFFTKYTKDGKVDYESIINHPSDLNELVKYIGKANLAKADENVVKAFYLNAHNLLVVYSVVESYPIRSPYDVEGFYNQKLHNVAGEMITLEQLENEKIFNSFRDFRMVFALSNGMNGSFPAPEQAYSPNKLERQLEMRMRLAANNENFVRVKKNSSKILFSETIKRCKRDLKAEELLEYLNQYRSEAIPISYSIEFYPSDRRLNIKEK
ncbi:MAG: DUF547 domain-containing protein [Cytophagaceae bacterium]